MPRSKSTPPTLVNQLKGVLSGKPGFEHVQGNLGQIFRLSARLSAEFFFLSCQQKLVLVDFGESSKSKLEWICFKDGFDWGCLGVCVIESSTILSTSFHLQHHEVPVPTQDWLLPRNTHPAPLPRFGLKQPSGYISS